MGKHIRPPRFGACDRELETAMGQHPATRQGRWQKAGVTFILLQPPARFTGNERGNLPPPQPFPVTPQLRNTNLVLILFYYVLLLLCSVLQFHSCIHSLEYSYNKSFHSEPSRSKNNPKCSLVKTAQKMYEELLHNQLNVTSELFGGSLREYEDGLYLPPL